MLDRLGKPIKDDDVIVYDDGFYILANTESGRLEGYEASLRYRYSDGKTVYSVHNKLSKLKNRDNAVLVELRPELHDALLKKVAENAVSSDKRHTRK